MITPAITATDPNSAACQTAVSTGVATSETASTAAINAAAQAAIADSSEAAQAQSKEIVATTLQNDKELSINRAAKVFEAVSPVLMKVVGSHHEDITAIDPRKLALLLTQPDIVSRIAKEPPDQSQTVAAIQQALEQLKNDYLEFSKAINEDHEKVAKAMQEKPSNPMPENVSTVRDNLLTLKAQLTALEARVAGSQDQEQKLAGMLQRTKEKLAFLQKQIDKVDSENLKAKERGAFDHAKAVSQIHITDLKTISEKTNAVNEARRTEHEQLASTMAQMLVEQAKATWKLNQLSNAYPLYQIKALQEAFRNFRDTHIVALEKALGKPGLNEKADAMKEEHAKLAQATKDLMDCIKTTQKGLQETITANGKDLSQHLAAIRFYDAKQRAASVAQSSTAINAMLTEKKAQQDELDRCWNDVQALCANCTKKVQYLAACVYENNGLVPWSNWGWKGTYAINPFDSRASTLTLTTVTAAAAASPSSSSDSKTDSAQSASSDSASTNVTGSSSSSSDPAAAVPSDAVATEGAENVSQAP